MRPLNNCLKTISILNRHEPIVVFDCETTGLKKADDRVIEFAAVLLEYNGGRYFQTDSIDLYINPGFPISDEIINLTGITNKQLADCEDETRLFDQIKGFLDKGRIISGYNVSFDIAFINNMFKRCSGDEFSPETVIDAYTMAKELVKADDIGGHITLGAMSDYYATSEGTFHNALDDVKNTVKIIFAEVWDAVEQYKDTKDLPKMKLVEMSRWKKSKYTDKMLITVYTGTQYVRGMFDMIAKEFQAGDKYFAGFNPTDMYAQMEKYSAEAGFKKITLFK